MDALFSKMAAFYGSAFVRQWADVDAGEVKAVWAVELAKLQTAQLKAGADGLAAFPKPPTLPQFIEYCRQARREQVAQAAPALTDQRRADKAVIEGSMRKIREMQSRVTTGTRTCQATPRWAFENLLRGTMRNGATLTGELRKSQLRVVVSHAGRMFVRALSREVAEQYRQVMLDAEAELAMDAARRPDS
ncbi:hypothetical protein [Burkholderia stagnalis]|nr:hypothetical protein [Burkholderia stagnalis]